MNRTTKTATLTVADVTKAPALRPILTDDGVPTGVWLTLAPCVALDAKNRPTSLPTGSRITAPTCGGFHGVLGSNYEGRTLVGNGSICFRR